MLCNRCVWNRVGERDQCCLTGSWLYWRSGSQSEVRWTYRNSITWELARNSNSLAQAQPIESDVVGLGLSIYVLTKHPGNADARSSLKTTGLDYFIITFFLPFHSSRGPMEENKQNSNQNIKIQLSYKSAEIRSCTRVRLSFKSDLESKPGKAGLMWGRLNLFRSHLCYWHLGSPSNQSSAGSAWSPLS